ncbi:unnamed protein product [Lactuca saligna]|uniref:PUA domain-containing protein n=1 Tax=Lactuca saligna TaxID=75948 RepID=A0AA36EH47_LACSI|nr:unnamed protein product [Lactuca saligna]
MLLTLKEKDPRRIFKCKALMRRMKRAFFKECSMKRSLPRLSSPASDLSSPLSTGDLRLTSPHRRLERRLNKIPGQDVLQGTQLLAIDVAAATGLLRRVLLAIDVAAQLLKMPILEIQCDKRLQDTVKNGDIESLSVLKSQIPGLDYVVFVKGSGPHDIQYDYQQDKPPKEIIVICKCAEAVLRGAQVYVPGILARNAHVEKGDLVEVSVGVEQPSRDNGWAIGITRGIVLQGLQGLKTDPQYLARDGLYISQGTTTMSRARMFHGLLGLAVDMNDRVFKLTSFNGGHISSKPVKHHHCTCLRSTRGRKNIGHVCCPWWKNNCNYFPYER